MARCGARSLRRLGVLDVRCLRLAPGHNVDLLATRGHGAYDGKWLIAAPQDVRYLEGGAAKRHTERHRPSLPKERQLPGM
jgi:hypothetical protein